MAWCARSLVRTVVCSLLGLVSCRGAANPKGAGSATSEDPKGAGSAISENLPNVACVSTPWLIPGAPEPERVPSRSVTHSEALAIATRAAPYGVVLVEERVFPFGWVFSFAPKSGAPGDETPGSGPIAVESATGCHEIISYPGGVEEFERNWRARAGRRP